MLLAQLKYFLIVVLALKDTIVIYREKLDQSLDRVPFKPLQEMEPKYSSEVNTLSEFYCATRIDLVKPLLSRKTSTNFMVAHIVCHF